MRYSQLLPIAMLLIPYAAPAESSDATSPLPQMEPLAFGCGGCHGASGEGYGSIPRISGKPEAEFIRLMQDFRAEKRPATVMDRIARGFSNEDFAALAKHFSHR
jgi:sulfide dehydrogenase cytochrome subunit